MGLESFLSSLIFKTVLFGIQGKVQEWFRVTARVRESVILSLDNRSFLWCDLLFFVHLFFCGKPHEGHQHQKPFCISLLCEGWLKRKHSNTNFSVALFTVVQYFWSFLSLLLISFSSFSSFSWQPFTAMSTHIITARSGQQGHGLTFSGALYCGSSFSQSLRVWKLLSAPLLLFRLYIS